MIKDNVADTVKAIAKFIAARGIPGMLECRDNLDDLYLSRAWIVGNDRRSLEVYLYVSSERGDRFESEGAVFRPLKVRASVSSTGTSMTAGDAAAYSSLLLKVAELARDIEREFSTPVYECLVTAQEKTSNTHAALALAHVQEEGKGLRVGRSRHTNTTLPNGDYFVDRDGKSYRVTSLGDGECSVERTA